MDLDLARKPRRPGVLKVADKGSTAVAYLYADGGGKAFYAMAFCGRRLKHDGWYRFPSAARREQWVRGYFEQVREREAARGGRKAEPHKLQLGHILRTCWGYDQTNVEFFEVTRIVGPFTVELREIAQTREETGWLQGRCGPKLGEYIGDPIIRRAAADGRVRIDECRRASLWDMKPANWTAYH